MSELVELLFLEYSPCAPALTDPLATPILPDASASTFHPKFEDASLTISEESLVVSEDSLFVSIVFKDSEVLFILVRRIIFLEIFSVCFGPNDILRTVSPRCIPKGRHS